MEASENNLSAAVTRYTQTMGMALLLMLFFNACVDESDHEDCRKANNRTVLFYMAGDNNLSGEVSEKTEQLKTVLLPAGYRLVIYQDTRDTPPELLEVVRGNGQNTLSIVREYEEHNSATAVVFASVIREVATLFPSDSYGLLFFSHASGWMPEQTYNNPQLRSIGNDKGEEMELAAFAEAIPDGMFDFIIFEACHMAGIEVAWELKDKTNYIIASSAEIVSPGFAPVYSKALPCLLGREPDLRRFVEIVANDYRTRQGDNGSLTLSLIDTRGLDGVAAAAKGSGSPLPSGGNIQSFDRNGKDLFFDFGDYYSALLTEAHYANVQTAIDKCVIRKTATSDFMPTYGGFEIRSHSGLTTYIPQEKYPKLNEAYRQLKWYKEVLNNEEK